MENVLSSIMKKKKSRKILLTVVNIKKKNSSVLSSLMDLKLFPRHNQLVTGFCDTQFYLFLLCSKMWFSGCAYMNFPLICKGFVSYS